MFCIAHLQLSLAMFSNPQLSFPPKRTLIFSCVSITDFVAARSSRKDKKIRNT